MKIYKMKYVDVWLKIENVMINWKEFTIPGWESNPGHLFRCHTTRPPGSASDTVNRVYMNRYQNTYIYHIYENLSL